MPMLAIVGLLIIAVAWLIQLAYMWGGDREIRLPFVLVYVIGVALLAVDTYPSSTDVAKFQLASLAASIFVLAKLATMKQKR